MSFEKLHYLRIYRTLSLSSSSSHPEWLNLDDIDIPLRQRHLSCAIDEAMYQNLLDMHLHAGLVLGQTRLLYPMLEIG